jgi:hypothetical protein
MPILNCKKKDALSKQLLKLGTSLAENIDYAIEGKSRKYLLSMRRTF